MISTVFTVIVVVLGAAYSPPVVLGIPIAILTGMAFAAPIAAFSATQRTPARFNVIFRFIITPLFLFSGVFFPIDTLPSASSRRLAVAVVARRGAHPRARLRRRRAARLMLVHLDDPRRDRGRRDVG